jgi:hypothetical protein
MNDILLLSYFFNVVYHDAVFRDNQSRGHDGDWILRI